MLKIKKNLGQTNSYKILYIFEITETKEIVTYLKSRTASLCPLVALTLFIFCCQYLEEHHQPIYGVPPGFGGLSR